MTNALRLLFACFLALGAIHIGCAAGETVGNPGTGNVTGGSAGTIGTITGAAGTGAGNVTGAAGTTASHGGTTGSGNTAGTTAARGGTTGTGNTTGAAGTTGTGNTTGTAGTTGTGTAGTTGMTGTCGASFAVAADGFVTAPGAAGVCWSGYASAGGNTASTVMPASFAMCGAGCMLKVTGTVGPSVSPDYAGYAYLGFNVGQPPGGTVNTPVTPKGTGIKVTFANSSATTTLRAQLVGDATGTIIWCANVTGASPVMIPYSMFTKACYNTPPGAAYAKEPIASVQLNIPGEATAKALNLTLQGVAEY